MRGKLIDISGSYESVVGELMRRPKNNAFYWCVMFCFSAEIHFWDGDNSFQESRRIADIDVMAWNSRKRIK